MISAWRLVAGGLEASDRWLAALLAVLPRPVRVVAVTTLVVSAVAAFVHFVGALLLHDPAVWPDEALFANPVVNLLRHGHLGTDLMGGYLPGIETRTYWMPPLYSLALAPLFALFGVDVTVMRLFSAFAADVVLVLTYAVGRRAGLERAAAGTAVALLAVDALFLRAARIGRMDMLAMALMLGALHQALAPPSAPVRSTIAAGILAGLAAITHPLGTLAAMPIALHLAGAPTCRRRLLLFSTAAVAPVLVWCVYLLGDWTAFTAQLGAQFGRKAARQPFNLGFLMQSFRLGINQYNESGDLSLGDPRDTAALIWALGTLGIGLFALQRRAARLLLFAHAVGVPVVLLSYEMWYPVYLLPTIALGVGALLGPALEHVPGRRLAAVAVLAGCGWFALRNVAYERGLHARWSGAGADYRAFCDRIDALLPEGSRVFVSVFPDVYLGLARRSDLSFRSFVPEQLPVSAETHRRVISESDIIVTGRWNPGGPADVMARQRGELLAEIGSRSAYTYHALVYRMPRATGP